jgi:hypothetical protein
MPPWGWHRRVRRLWRDLPPRTADVAQGDLLEEYAERHTRHGRWAAEWWLMAELSSLRRAYRRASPRGPHPPRRRHLVLRGDLVQSLRSLRRAPWYAATVVGVIAISLALSTTVFAVVDGALFKPLPYGDSGRLFSVALGWSRLHEPLRMFPAVSPSEFHAWSAAVPDAALTAYARGMQTVGVRDSVRSGHVDATFFDVVGSRPILGGFAPQDFHAVQRIQPAVVTYRFWRNGSAPNPARSVA